MGGNHNPLTGVILSRVPGAPGLDSETWESTIPNPPRNRKTDGSP
jgi:hypothetical protein